jgi:hypothetical protein
VVETFAPLMAMSHPLVGEMKEASLHTSSH